MRSTLLQRASRQLCAPASCNALHPRIFSTLSHSPSTSSSPSFTTTSSTSTRSFHPSSTPSSPSLSSPSSTPSSLLHLPPNAPFEPAIPLSYGYRAGPLSPSDVAQYERDGFLIKRRFYTEQEMAYLLRIAKADRDLTTHAIDVPDAAGKTSKLSVWNYLGEDDIYSMIGRGERMAGAMEQLLGDEPYHYHSKMMLKEPKVGGAWEWHQDYGYWYKNGVLAPRLASGLIAVDRATKANGCLQVLKGSHHFGRIEHGVSGGQTGADMDYLEAIAARCDKVYIECEAGDVLFFHCNLLHASAPNLSDYPRWSLICCYNAKSNDPIRKSHHPNYHPLHRVPDTAIVEYGRRWTERMDKGEKVESSKERLAAFLNPDDDASTPGSRRAEA